MIVLRRDSRPSRRGQKHSALQFNGATAQPRASQRESLYENQSPALDSLYRPIRFFCVNFHLS